jgi:CDP-glucose 4,6-dehydratase
MRLPNPDFWQNKKVFLTGERGFKGQWLSRWLKKIGSIVYVMGDANLLDRKELTSLLEGYQPEIVMHLAAVTTVQEAFSDPIKAITTNAVGTAILLEVLKGIRSVKAILNVTTDKVYHTEGIDRGYVESDSLGGLELYAVSKVCSEYISTVYQKTYRLPLVTARAGNMIGGGDWKETRIIPNFFNAWAGRKQMDVNVNAVRPWQYVLDGLCGYLLLCEELYDNVSYVGAWNFASNEFESRSVQWIVDELNTHVNPQVDYRLVDARGYYETKNLKLCSDKARKVLGWEPKYNMKETVRRTAKWYTSFLEGISPDLLYGNELDDYIGGA